MERDEKTELAIAMTKAAILGASRYYVTKLVELGGTSEEVYDTVKQAQEGLKTEADMTLARRP